LGVAKPDKKLKENCPKDWHEVANNRCCPNDHPHLIMGDCYATCDEGYDDYQIGSFIGCREQCEPGYGSTLNTCKRGASHHARVDITRNSVTSELQSRPRKETVTNCPKDHIQVSRLWVAGKRQGKKRLPGKPRKAGGCCPKTSPVLIGRRCYPECPENQDSIMVGSFIGCRAHCPDGWKENHNECQKDGEETVERSDFPRDGVRPVNRVHDKKRANEIDAGCNVGYEAASSNYCCPTIRPQLKGLLCYERCNRGYDESAYGCRKKCPRSWTQHLLTCTRKGRVFSRKGYERKPMPSQARKKKDAITPLPDDDLDGKTLVE